MLSLSLCPSSPAATFSGRDALALRSLSHFIVLAINHVLFLQLALPHNKLLAFHCLELLLLRCWASAHDTWTSFQYTAPQSVGQDGELNAFGSCRSCLPIWMLNVYCWWNLRLLCLSGSHFKESLHNLPQNACNGCQLTSAIPCSCCAQMRIEDYHIVESGKYLKYRSVSL